MQLIANLLINGFVVAVSAYLLPGVKVDGFLTAILVAVVLSLVTTFIEPLVLLLTLPVNILTLGLFTLVINAAMILLVSAIVPGFKVDGLLWAFLFSLVLSVVSSITYSLMSGK